MDIACSFLLLIIRLLYFDRKPYLSQYMLFAKKLMNIKVVLSQAELSVLIINIKDYV